jgi:Polysaccharide lyase family 8, C-terminal beta-sandwich domain./Polysaccharide lyase family 8, N terminal alpha-helical domain./Polysaccharide lyase family 8, super-sandwich domain.
MKKVTGIFLLLFWGNLSSGILYATDPDIELLRQRFTAEVIAPTVNEDHIRLLTETIQPDGSWAAIDYADTSRVAFQHVEHLNHLLSMARAYQKQGTRWHKEQFLKNAFSSALDFWLTHDFICENWWNNQIGTPQTMVSLLFMMDDDLTEKQITKMLQIAGRAHLQASGARPSGDRIKIAGILAKTALFRRDVSLFEEVIAIIEGEIKFAVEEPLSLNAEGGAERMLVPGTARGMQYDYSFHHRTDRVNNTLSYGSGYAEAFVEWASKVADTRYRFSERSLRHLIDYYLDGMCKQMVYGKRTDPGVMNRDMARPGGGRVATPRIPLELLRTTDYRKEELEQIVRVRRGLDVVIPSFATFFWQTEHFACQRPYYYTSVRMYSVRNNNMEMPYNGEGLMNHFRADGANYISVRGDEYEGLAAVYDYHKIPGTTVLQMEEMPPENEIQKQGLTNFVGGMTDGIYGGAVFDFKSPHHPLSAKKAWFFFDREYICLGSGIRSDVRQHPVATTINQCRLQGDVFLQQKDAQRPERLTQGLHTMEEAGWVYHDSVGYIFPQPQRISLSNETATGNMHRVNRQTSVSGEEIRQDVFKLWIDHGIRPYSDTYEYVVIPGAELEQVKAYGDDPSIQILSNTLRLQAVKHRLLNIASAVFYAGEELVISDDLTCRMDVPGMLMIRYDTGDIIRAITVADPSRQLRTVHLSVNTRVDTTNKNCRIVWDPAKRKSYIAIELPQGVYAGKSVTIDF